MTWSESDDLSTILRGRCLVKVAVAEAIKGVEENISWLREVRGLLGF